MKRTTLTLLLAVAMVSRVLASTVPANVETTILTSLKQQFPGAQFAQVKEVEGESLYTVRMVYQDESMLAYSKANGEIVALVRALSRERLPMLVNERLRSQYNDYKLRQSEELTMNGETSYMFLLENEKQTVTLRVYSNGDARVLKKIKK
jgi:hypothetical protein